MITLIEGKRMFGSHLVFLSEYLVVRELWRCLRSAEGKITQIAQNYQRTLLEDYKKVGRPDFRSAQVFLEKQILVSASLLFL